MTELEIETLALTEGVKRGKTGTSRAGIPIDLEALRLLGHLKRETVWMKGNALHAPLFPKDGALFGWR